ncbi:MAG: glucosyltransferase domain-containing protein [Cyanobium sp.]
MFALALRRLWIPGSASIYGILIGLLISLFPYHINLLSFQLQHPSMVMSYLTGAYAVANVDRRGWRRWLSVLAIAASLSYQTMIAYFIAAGLVLFLILLLRREQPGDQRLVKASRWRPLLAYIQLLGFGLIAYLVFSLLAVRMAGVPVSGRTSFAAVDALPQKLQLIINHIKRTAFGKEPSLVRSSKLMQSALWAVVGVGLLAERWRSERRLLALALVIASLGVVPLLIVASAFLPTILMDHTSENPRNLLATVVFAAGGLALSSLLGSRTLRLAAVVLVAGMVLSYGVSTNALSVDQARLTSRDLLQASRMVERLDQLKGDKPVRSVVFSGSYTPATGLRGREYYQSAFQVPWAKVPMLQEATGQVFQEPSEAERAAMLKLAADRQPWPAKDSVAVQGDVGLIVLGKP